MPKPSDPHVAAQGPRLRGAAFDPGWTARAQEREAERNWEALLGARLIGKVQQPSPEVLASIDAAERAMRVGKYRWQRGGSEFCV